MVKDLYSTTLVPLIWSFCSDTWSLHQIPKNIQGVWFQPSKKLSLAPHILQCELNQYPHIYPLPPNPGLLAYTAALPSHKSHPSSHEATALLPLNSQTHLCQFVCWLHCACGTSTERNCIYWLCLEGVFLICWQKNESWRQFVQSEDWSEEEEREQKNEESGNEKKKIFLIDLNIFLRLRFTYTTQAYRHKHKKKYVWTRMTKTQASLRLRFCLKCLWHPSFFFVLMVALMLALMLMLVSNVWISV